MVAVRRRNAKAPLATASQTVLPHRKLDPPLAHGHALRAHLPPYRGPGQALFAGVETRVASIGPVHFVVDRTNLNQQGRLAQMPARQDLLLHARC